MRKKGSQPQASSPEMSETSEAYIAEMELPGLSAGSFSVELAGQELLISGQLTCTPAAGSDPRGGRPAFRFEYRVVLPGPAEPATVTAWQAHGLLTVVAARAEAR
jgi:HSP20 family molecular chaperone IbpA